MVKADQQTRLNLRSTTTLSSECVLCCEFCLDRLAVEINCGSPSGVTEITRVREANTFAMIVDIIDRGGGQPSVALPDRFSPAF